MERQKMKNITIALPDVVMDILKDLKKQGKVPSRSEAVRMALRPFFKKELKLIDSFGYKIVGSE